MKNKGRKRTNLPRACDYTKQFQKDWKRLERTGRFDMGCLKQAMMLLVANDEPLGGEWLDHPLTGKWNGYRECHIGGDFLLIYEIDESYGKSGIVVFSAAGTHSELFG